MRKHRTPGIFWSEKNGGEWCIDKRYLGVRIRCNTGSGEAVEAESRLAHEMQQVRAARVYGETRPRSWKECCARYLQERAGAPSVKADAWAIEATLPWLGDKLAHEVHMGSLRPAISKLQTDRRRKDGRALAPMKSKSINNLLATHRAILNKAAGEYIDDMSGKPWLSHAPKIVMQKVRDATPAYTLSWEEQAALLNNLNEDSRPGIELIPHTGLRDSEVCALRWEWERSIPELGITVFDLPGDSVKNEEERVVVLNAVATRIIDGQRGQHPEFVFTYKGQPRASMHTTAYKNAWAAAGLPTNGRYQKGVHNLRHTFSRRLRAAGVAKETRSNLLGHKDADITTHYSAAEVAELLEAVRKIESRTDGVLLRAVK